MKQRIKGDQGVADAENINETAQQDQSGIVQCKNYRCWAKKGPDAKWRDMHGTLLDVLQVVAEF
jgi:hypothetical protein